MNFVFYVSEQGQQLQMKNCQESQKVIQLQEQLQVSLKIDISDQILISSEGYKLNPQQTLSSIDIDKIFGKSESPYPLFIFNNKNLRQSSSEFITHLKESLIQNDTLDSNYLIQNQIIDQDYSETNNGEEIQDYLQIRNSYLEFINRKNKLKKTFDSCKIQQMSFQALFLWLRQNYKETKNVLKDIKRQKDSIVDKNQTIGKNFEGWIGNLKKIELHQELQKDGQKFLMDVYYKEEEMVKWLKTCQETQKSTQSRLEQCVQIIKNAKNKVADEKTQIQKAEDFLKEYELSFEDQIGFDESILLSLFLSQQEAFKNYLDDNTALPTIQDKTVMVKSFDIIKKLYEQILKHKIQQAQNVVKFLKFTLKYNQDFIVIQDKLKSFNQDFERIQKDFSYLMNPQKLPLAYQQSLSEISRRREFQQIYNKKQQKLKSILEIEQDKRKKFSSEYGKILPIDFLQCLQEQVPNIKLENIESNLPQIESKYQIIIHAFILFQSELLLQLFKYFCK